MLPIFLIWGTKILASKNKKIICPIGIEKCSNCHRKTPHVLCYVNLWFTIFFIPILNLGERYGMKCGICGSISKKYIKAGREDKFEEALRKLGVKLEDEA